MSNSPLPLVCATRPEAQNADWIMRLREAGFRTADIPMLAIEPVQDEDSVQAVKNLIVDYDQFNKVIFVSQNAVTETHHWLDQYWPQLPMGIEYFAVGDKTAAAARALGMQASGAGVAMNSDALLDLPALQDVWGQRVLICRGKGGLPKLGEVLHERGAFVHYCELYYRRAPAQAQSNFDALLGEVDEQNIVVPLFSGETLSHFDHLVGDDRGGLRSSLRLVVPGKRVKQQAEQLGFVQVSVAENATAEAMLSQIQTLFPRPLD